ncbi:hypothetical protein Patl1_29389 [Pistacia atlantica]|uniref:Uncharacterized protein n=1 Tax=Pistacia atlantica TaxID=434234 RepID=A0ACC1AAR5_9ROSI|nr:hypothetical protein Patl1_29389 [Pistacia atlantica]
MVTAGTMGGAGSSGSTSGIKKPRLINSQTTTNSHTSTSTATPPRSFDTSSSHQDASFKETLPGQVRAPAVFKCVRVTAGVDNTREGFPNISELHLGGAGSSGGVGGGGGGGRNGGCSSPPILDPSEVYAGGGGGGLLGGSGYGNPMN